MITSDRRIYGGWLSRIPRRKCRRPYASPFKAAATSPPGARMPAGCTDHALLLARRTYFHPAVRFLTVTTPSGQTTPFIERPNIRTARAISLAKAFLSQKQSANRRHLLFLVRQSPPSRARTRPWYASAR